MRDVEQKSSAVSLFGTVLVWILIFLFFYFGQAFFKPKEFKTIKIRLDSPAEQVVSKKQEETRPSEPEALPSPATATKAESVAKTEASTKKSTKGESSSAEKINKNSASSRQNASKEIGKSEKKNENLNSRPDRMSETTLQKSIDELIAEQQQAKKPVQKKKSAEEIWAEMEAMEGNSSSSPSPTAVAKNSSTSQAAQTAFSGSAASANTNSTAAKSESKSNSKSGDNQTASSSTAAALKNAMAATKYSSSANGISSSVTATSSQTNGKVSIQMSDGKTRILLEPSEPKITLSPEAASQIDSTKQLTITFIVTASGNVPVTNIKISPDILPSLVSMEIKEQISNWRFQSAETAGQAQFSYTIQKQ